jgi:Restriction endonuclease
VTFDHLTDGEFEELVYDLLRELGFVNLSWRRGTGKQGASADQGRDIVATLMRRDPDGTEHPERWFVQCKRYERGVPPEALQAALAWSIADRPAVLAFAVSNFLSNPSKSFLEGFLTNNRPPFKIRLWERKDLEQMLAGRLRLASRFRLEPGAPYAGAHKAHLEYLFSNPLNTLPYLFEQFDTLEATDRDEILDYAYISLLASSHVRPPRSRGEAPRLLEKMSYDHFRAECRRLSGTVFEGFLVRAIVSWTLAWWWPNANPALVAETRQRHNDMISHLSDRAQRSEEPAERAKLEAAVAFVQRQLDEQPKRHARAVVLYNLLCDLISPRLYLEDSLGRKQTDA